MAFFRRSLGSWLLLCVGIGAAPLESGAQPYGRENPVPVGAFLNGVFPPRTPNAPDTSDWIIQEAFPSLDLQDTLVIAANPSNDRLYVASRNGVIVSFPDQPTAAATTPFLDLSDRTAVVWDGGFLGLAFHPEFGQPGSPWRGTFYVYYSSHCPLDAARNAVNLAACDNGYPRGSTGGFFNTYLRLSRFRVADGQTTADPASEVILVNIRLYNGSHRGGGPSFGNDGMLYLAIGDQFRYTTAQDIVNDFEGGSFRFQVDVSDNGNGTWSCPAGSHLPRRRFDTSDEITGRWYCVPDDNPWLDPGGGVFEEYFSIGHRNPHRISVDPVTGRLWSGEVGENSREEINVIEKGHNYGWPFREGTIAGPRSAPAEILGVLTEPVVDFSREEARTIIGGYVYRGSRFPELVGRFIAGDYSTRNVWAITYNDVTGGGTKDLLTTFSPGALATFGQSRTGEIYFGNLGAGVTLHQLARVGSPVPDPPALLSQTGAFRDLAALDPNVAFLPYDLNVPFWSDGAQKKRWVAVPNDGTHDTAAERIGYSETDSWSWPTGTVLMKHFDLPLDASSPGQIARLETRFQVKGDDGNFYGLTYRWLPDGSDAQLLTTGATADYTVQTVSGPRTQTWLFPSRDQCRFCHGAAAGGALGPRTHGLHRDLTYPGTGVTDDQLRTWNHLGLLSPALSEAAIPALPRAAATADARASLQDRARGWLDANCSYCHRPGTGNRAQFDARLGTDLLGAGLVYGGVINPLGLDDPAVIVPGDLLRSVAFHRASALGAIAMPPLAKARVDDYGVGVLADWIERIDPGFPSGGVNYEYYETGALSVLPNFDALTPVRSGGAGTFDISLRNRDDDFAFRFRAWLRIDTAETYTFYTTSDDGSRLSIDGALVVNNDGLHAPQERSGSIALQPGWHAIEATMFERGGGESLTVQYASPSISKRLIPTGNLFRQIPNLDVNLPPDLAQPAPQVFEEGEPVVLQLVSTDPDGPAPHFEARQLPPGLAIDADTGLVSGTPAGGSAGAYPVTFSVSDGPAVDVAEVSVTVQPPNDAPVVTNPGPQGAREYDTFSLEILGDDPDDGPSPLVWHATGLPPGITLLEGRSALAGRVAAGAAAGSPWNVTVTASDGQEERSVTFAFTVLRDECNDLADNDGDGSVDAADAGCGGGDLRKEAPPCSDGIDNDLDGFADFDGAGQGAPDPECGGLAWRSEVAAPACGLGFEVALLLPLLLWGRRRRGDRVAG